MLNDTNRPKCRTLTSSTFGHIRFCPTLLAHYLDYDLSAPGPVVQVQEDYLLPCAKCHLSFDEGHGEARPQDRGSDVRVAVSVTLSKVMGVVSILGRNPFQGPFHVLDEARLVLDGG